MEAAKLLILNLCLWKFFLINVTWEFVTIVKNIHFLIQDYEFNNSKNADIVTWKSNYYYYITTKQCSLSFEVGSWKRKKGKEKEKELGKSVQFSHSDVELKTMCVLYENKGVSIRNEKVVLPFYVTLIKYSTEFQ